MSPEYTAEEIRQKYERFARWYDLAEALPELLGVWALRRRLIRKAVGRVLEVAVGTGKNLPYYAKYAKTCRITAIDLSPAMLEQARRRARKLGLEVDFRLGDATALDFPDHSFDTVVSSLSTCTFPDPVAALREMARVCRPEGRILLLEHGRSDREWLARWQDRRAGRHAEIIGCQWNREPLDHVRAAGLEVRSHRRLFFGILHLIEAGPAQ